MNEIMEMPSPEAGEIADVRQQPTGRQLSVVEYAVQSGAPVAEVARLVELQIRMDEHKLAMRTKDDERERELRIEAARNAYAAAMAAFKAEAVKVIRTKEITDGPLRGKKHADLKAVCDAATEPMSKHGLSTTWTTLEDTKDWIRIACIVKHVAGHSESVAFGGPVDTGPGRNAIQARKSTVTYLERLTMLLALGLAEGDADDDGAGGPTNAADMADQLCDSAGVAASLEALEGIWSAGVAAIRAAKDMPAYERFKAAVSARKAELRGAAQ